VQQWPLRALGADDVEVTVAMCGMNFADLYTRQGLLRERQPPFALGMECAGHVTKVGDNVTHIKVGDRVLCYQHTGDLFREHVVVASSQCFVLPSGQSILIHSCAGGVGWAATQLAHSVGSVTIYGTCSPGKRDAVIQNGVTHPLSHDTYEAELLKLSPQGVDVVIDNKSGSHFSTSQQLLKPLGRAVLIGINSVITGDQKLGLWSMMKMWWKTKSVTPTDLIMHSRVVAGLHLGLLMEKQPDRIQTAMNQIFHLYEKGKIKPQIDSIWPLEKVTEASKVLAEMLEKYC
ncbi:hypothetical protein L9F63_014419, partial [Diploptera punctata]